VNVRLALALALVAAALGAAATQDEPPRQSGPGEALREYQAARMNAIADCAKYSFAVDWGDLAPDSKIAAECMALISQPCVQPGTPRVSDTPDDPVRL
jgi:hypothetical protein